MKAALAQISPKLSRDNFDLHESIVKEVKDLADIAVFPELSLNGYMLMDSVYEDAYLLSELSVFEELSLDIDIVVGAVTKEEHKIYNSALYYSKGQLLNVHHKNNLPNYGMFQEARFFFAGDTLKSFMTAYGKAVVVVCEDMWSTSVIDRIAKEKPSFIYVIANSPARGFGDEDLEIETKWNRILATSAIFSGAYVVFVNRVGFEDGLGFWGGSKVITPSGKIKKCAKHFEKDVLIVSMDHQISYVQKYLLRSD